MRHVVLPHKRRTFVSSVMIPTPFLLTYKTSHDPSTSRVIPRSPQSYPILCTFLAFPTIQALPSSNSTFRGPMTDVESPKYSISIYVHDSLRESFSTSTRYPTVLCRKHRKCTEESIPIYCTHYNIYGAEEVTAGEEPDFFHRSHHSSHVGSFFAQLNASLNSREFATVPCVQ